MARAGDGNNLRPQAAMNMHHFAIPLPRPLAPGQNVTVRLVQAGVPSAHGQQQHAHFHFVMQGQAASPVLRDSQGLGAQQGKSKERVKLGLPIVRCMCACTRRKMSLVVYIKPRIAYCRVLKLSPSLLTTVSLLWHRGAGCCGLLKPFHSQFLSYMYAFEVFERLV